jgi:hypothetical protein
MPAICGREAEVAPHRSRAWPAPMKAFCLTVGRETAHGGKKAVASVSFLYT